MTFAELLRLLPLMGKPIRVRTGNDPLTRHYNQCVTNEVDELDRLIKRPLFQRLRRRCLADCGRFDADTIEGMAAAVFGDDIDCRSLPASEVVQAIIDRKPPDRETWPIVTTDPPCITIGDRSHDLKPEAAEWLLYLVNLRGEFGSVRKFEDKHERENVKPNRLMENLPEWILAWYVADNRGSRIRPPVSRA